MFRSRFVRSFAAFGLIVAALVTTMCPAPAAAQGCVYGPPVCVRPVVTIYAYTLQYQHGCHWDYYGTFYATQYADGSVDYGGMFEAQAALESQGLMWLRSNPTFVRTQYL